MYCRTFLLVSIIGSALSVSTDVKAPVVNKEVKDTPMDVHKDVPRDTPIDAPKDVPKVTPIDAPKDVPKVTPMDAHNDVPKVTPIDAQKNVPKVTPMDAHKDIPKVTPIDAPKDVPMVTPIDVQKDVPKVTPMDAPKDVHSSPVKRYASGYLKEVTDEVPDINNKKYVLVPATYQRDSVINRQGIYNPYLILRSYVSDAPKRIPSPTSTYVLEKSLPIVKKEEHSQKYLVVPQRQLDTSEYEKKIALVDSDKNYEDDIARKIKIPINAYTLERTVPLVHNKEYSQKYVIVPQRQLDTSEYEKKIALVDSDKNYEDDIARKIKIPINTYTLERTLPLVHNKEYSQKYIIVPQRQLDTSEYEKKIALVDSGKNYEDDISRKIKIPINAYTLERTLPLVHNKEYSQKYIIVPQRQLDTSEYEKKIPLVDSGKLYEDDIARKIQTPVNTYTVERTVPLIHNKEYSQKYLIVPQRQLDAPELEKKVTLVEEKKVDLVDHEIQ